MSQNKTPKILKTQELTEAAENWKNEKTAESIETIENMRFTARNDYAFKKLFGRPENIIILQDFLSAVLELNKNKFQDIVIENPLVGNSYSGEKQGILDIKLTLRDSRKINIEMQNLWEPHYEKRTYFYWASRYLEYFKQGEPYECLAKCIHISILNTAFPLTSEIHSIYQVLNIKDHRPFGDDLEFHFLDLTKLKANDTTDLEKWLRFIQTDDFKIRERLGKENAVMEYANGIMNQFFSSKEERLKYEAAFRYDCDRASLFAAGQETGVLQTARNMKAKNFDAKTIQEITGLTAEQIAAL